MIQLQTNLKEESEKLKSNAIMSYFKKIEVTGIQSRKP